MDRSKHETEFFTSERLVAGRMVTLHLDEQTGWRGGEQQASYLMKGLSQRGIKVIAAGRPNTPFLQTDHGIEGLQRVAAPFRGEWCPVTVWRLARLIRQEGVEIIHAHTSHSHTIACLARLFAGRGKVVVSRRVDFRIKSHVLNRIKYSLPDRIVAISDKIAEVLRSGGIDDAKLRTVHSAIDPKRLEAPPWSAEELAGLGIPVGAKLLGNVAALVGHKDHATLLAAMPEAMESVPDLHLLIAGEGALHSDLEEQARRLGIKERVHFLGYRKDVPRLLHTIHAFVLSSKEEGLGTSVLDAMACNLPVVATAGGGIPEMVHHERTGLLAPVGDSKCLAGHIIRVFTDIALAERLGRNACALVYEGFTVERMVEGNLEVYRELLNE